MEEDEIRKLAAEKKREKMEDKLARQRVKEQIEADKEARRARAAGMFCLPNQQIILEDISILNQRSYYFQQFDKYVLVSYLSTGKINILISTWIR